MSVEEWADIKQELVEKRKAVGALAAEMEAERASTLQGRLGETMEKRGISAFTLMREWDTNGDGELDREEFRQAVRRSLQLKASDEKIVELFDYLDTNGNGTLEIKTELRPAIKTIHLLYRTELERASLAREELVVCSELIKTVDLGIATAHRCNELKAEMMRERVGELSNLEAEIGVRAKALEVAGASAIEMAQAWGASQDGWARKDDFVRAAQTLTKKAAHQDGSFKREGPWESLAELPHDAIKDHVIQDIFDRAVTSLSPNNNLNPSPTMGRPAPPSVAAGGGASTSESTSSYTSGHADREPKMNVSDWLKRVALECGQSSRSSRATAFQRRQEKARAIQVAYAEQATRKKKHFEIAWRDIENAKKGVSDELGLMPGGALHGTMRAERVWG